jgi:hypothetical protein
MFPEIRLQKQPEKRPQDWFFRSILDAAAHLSVGYDSDIEGQFDE